MQRSLRRPLLYPLVRPLPRQSHVPRGCTKGRSAKVFVLNATRVPPAAWGSPRAFVVNSSTLGFLVWLAGLGRLVLQIYALDIPAIIRRSMPVPTTLRSQGCALATPASDADRVFLILTDSPSNSSSSFALGRAKQAAPPGDVRSPLHPPHHRPDARTDSSGLSDAHPGVDFIFLTPVSLCKTKLNLQPSPLQRSVTAASQPVFLKITLRKATPITKWQSYVPTRMARTASSRRQPSRAMNSHL